MPAADEAGHGTSHVEKVNINSMTVQLSLPLLPLRQKERH